MQDNLFNPAPFFLLRVPIWPLQHYKLFETEESLHHLFQSNELFREAVLIASPSLHQALQKPKKDLKETSRSLLRYALRMSSRAIPFGLFSFVAKGYFSNCSDCRIEQKNILRKIRPDMEWLYTFILKLYENPHHFPNLSVRINPYLEQRGDRIELSYLRSTAASMPSNSQVSIKLTSMLIAILSITEYPISISTLCQRLSQSFPDFDLVKTHGMISDLISQQFLLPGITPSLLEENPMKNFLGFEDIEEVNHMMESYMKTPIGQGEEILINLQNKMESLAKTKNYFQVDSFYTECVSISNKIAVEATKTATILWKISASLSGSSILSNYHSKFLDKYGIHRTVPLMELLNVERGLGPLEQSLFSSIQSRKTSSFSQVWQNWLFQQWQRCLNFQQKEIHVDEALIDSLLTIAKQDPPSEEMAPISFDFFCKILKPSETSSEQFRLLFIQPTWQGLSSFGRFLYLFDKETTEQWRTYLQQEETLEKDVLFVEISSWPSAIRCANIASQPSLRVMKLDLESKTKDGNYLSLDDFFVGATHDRLYLTTKESGQEICAVIGNVLNINLLSPPLRFMREVTLDRHHQIHPFSWGTLESNTCFLPRVCFHNTVISPARWHIDGGNYIKKKKGEIVSLFRAWTADWKLPLRLFLVEVDQRLLIDLQSPPQFQDIVKRLEKGESLTFEEYFEEQYIKISTGEHLSEIVLTFQKNHDKRKKKNSITPLVHQPIKAEERSHFFGSQWIYAKIYLSSYSMHRFLIDYLIPFAQGLIKQGQILGFFFIRYYDPDPHLRFRLKLSSLSSMEGCLLKFSDAWNKWEKTGLTKNVVFANYEKEIERYGGIEFFEQIEEFFCADSQSMQFLLSYLERDDPALQAASAIWLLRDLGFSQENMIKFLDSSSEDLSQLSGFRIHKSKLLELVEKTASQREENQYISILNKMSEIRSIAASKILQVSKVITLEAWINICQSLLHMHCNRMGCNLDTEKRTRLFALHILKYKFKIEIHKSSTTVAV